MSALSDALAKRTVELLEDQGWQDREMVVRELMKVVPPGLAIRRNEQNRLLNAQGRAARGEMEADNASLDGRSRPRATDKLIASGQRSYATQYIHQAAYEHRTNEAGAKQIRMLRLPRVIADARRRKERHDPVHEQLREEITVLRAYARGLEERLLMVDTHYDEKVKIEQLRTKHDIDTLVDPL